MNKFLSGKYKPSNPDKYIGNKIPVYRSSWELTVCQLCDNHPNIIQWASEPVKIPYVNPVTGKYTVYVPDFLVVFEDKNGKRRQELWEVKPKKQTFVEEAKTNRDKMALALNSMKWKAAQKWATDKGILFRVITESDIYRNF